MITESKRLALRTRRRRRKGNRQEEASLSPVQEFAQKLMRAGWSEAAALEEAERELKNAAIEDGM